ncbi:MAG: hypothetical protein V4710_20165 [Verrucomicrobiota bacterium]
MCDIPPNQSFEKRFARLLAESRDLNLAEAARRDPSRLLFLLAARFGYDVQQGGFAQLLYNMNGNFLDKIEEMLVIASAPVARDHYVRAIQACLANESEYQRFLASDFLEPNILKDTLHKISIDYFTKHVWFGDEAQAFLAETEHEPESN